MNKQQQQQQLTQDEEEELSQRLKVLLNEGKQVEGTSPEVDHNKRPNYFDEERFQEAQKVINKYYLSASTSSSVGLILLLQLDEILLPLIKTGKSRTVVDLYDRYSATALYIKRVYESPFYEPTSDGWKYVMLVRAMHQRIFKLMNTNNSETDDSNQQCDNDSTPTKTLWVNQYDMALTQFAFTGLLLLRPDKCAAPKVTEQELGQVTYIWRLLSHQLGIEERFNLFVYHDHVAKQVRYMELIFEHFKVKLAVKRNPIGVRMGEGFLLSFESLAKFVTFNIVERHWFDTISLSGRAQRPECENLAEKWKEIRQRAMFKLTSCSEITRSSLTRMYKQKLEKFCRQGDKVKKKLAKKYSNHTYDLSDEPTT